MLGCLQLVIRLLCIVGLAVLESSFHFRSSLQQGVSMVSGLRYWSSELSLVYVNSIFQIEP